MSKLKVFCALLAALAGVAATARATVLQRAGLEELVAHSSIILVAEVTDSYSYWNDEGTFLLTQASIVPVEVLKGDPPAGKIPVTLLGGSDGDLTVLVVGMAILEPDRPYVVFLDHADLPGAENVLTPVDLVQGVFDVVERDGKLRAVSQAAGFPLVSDGSGAFEAAGGTEGYPFEEMITTIQDLAAKQ
jgi:hypothetical protein